MIQQQSSSDVYWLGGVKMGYFLMGKLGKMVLIFVIFCIL